MTAGATAARKSFVRRALTENLGLKILALAAAIALFVIVRGTEDAQISVPVAVVALLPTDGRMLVTEIPDEIRVTLRGSRSVLNAVRRGGLQPIQMDLREGRGHFHYFEQDELELPAGASFVSIAPSAVALRWVDRADRRFRIDPVVEGAVARGFAIAATSVEPSAVRVRGASTEVARLEQVRTAAVDVSGLSAGRHERRVPLGPLPEHVSYVETDSVVVTVTIEEEIATRTLSELDVAVVGATDAIVRPAQVSVVVRGSRNRVDEVEPRRFVPFVDVTELDASRGAQPVAVVLRGAPEGMTARIEPSEVLVTLPNR